MFGMSKRNLSFLMLSYFVLQLVVLSQAESTTSSEDKHQEIILQTQDSTIQSDTFLTAEESSSEINSKIEESPCTSSNNLDDGV